MFKIKVGLKSFQIHSMQKCKHQIGQIVSYLKRERSSFSTGWKEIKDDSTPPLPRERALTLERRPHSNLLTAKKENSHAGQKAIAALYFCKPHPHQ